MKARLILIIAAVALLLISGALQKSKAQEIPDCWCIPCMNTEWEKDYNPLMLAIDTCGFLKPGDWYYDYLDCCDFVRNPSAKILDLITQKRYYSKNGWSILFGIIAIKLPWAPEDSIVECTWREVDTVYKEIRQKFQEIEEKYGNFKLRKLFPNDTTYYNIKTYNSQIFRVFFSNYVNSVEVVEYLKAIPNLGAGGPNYFDCPTLVIEADNMSKNIFEIFPNPSENQITIKIIEKNTKNKFIDIYSLDGKLHITQLINYNTETFCIDISKLNSGTYLIKYGNFQSKLFIKR